MFFRYNCNAMKKEIAMLEVVKKTAKNCFIPITVGGGVSNS